MKTVDEVKSKTWQYDFMRGQTKEWLVRAEYAKALERELDRANKLCEYWRQLATQDKRRSQNKRLQIRNERSDD